MVETALVMPIILLFMTGMFSLSTVLYQKLELIEAVSSGARFLAVDRGDTDPCRNTTASIETRNFVRRCLKGFVSTLSARLSEAIWRGQTLQ